MGERFLIVSFFSSLSRSYCTVGQKTKSWSHLGALELNQGNEPGKGRDTMSLNTGELVDPINILFLSLFSPPYRLYQSQISMRSDLCKGKNKDVIKSEKSSLEVLALYHAYLGGGRGQTNKQMTTKNLPQKRAQPLLSESNRPEKKVGW